MADTMTCPLCGRQHPAGTTWCPVLFQDISHLLGGVSVALPASQESELDVREPDAEPVDCPNCGARGRAGEACIQCMEVIPRPTSGIRQARQVYVVLPSMQGVAIPRGTEVAIGRRSSIAAISTGLEAFDGVSRRHCYVTIDTVRDTATIRDPGSLNHTWVGDDANQLGAEERRETALPVRIRLGQTAYLTITAEGA